MSGVEVRCGDRAVTVPPGQTLLEAMEQSGMKVPSSCRAGVCQSCLMQATAGAPPKAAQVGLKEPQKNRNLFLACLCKPAEPLTVQLAADDAYCGLAPILAKERLGPEVIRVRFRSPAGLAFRAGQFLTFRRPDGLARSYSVASLPQEGDFFDIHVRVVDGGKMTGWLQDGATPGDELEIRGPRGDCFYVPGRPEDPLLLVGIGTGSAPLAALARDALQHGHRGDIRFWNGGATAKRLHLTGELDRLAAAAPNFAVTHCVREGAEPGMASGDIVAHVTGGLTRPAAVRAYLCGDPQIVDRLRRALFLKGVSLRSIFADPFVGNRDG